MSHTPRLSGPVHFQLSADTYSPIVRKLVQAAMKLLKPEGDYRERLDSVLGKTVAVMDDEYEITAYHASLAVSLMRLSEEERRQLGW